jgi:hypothetical protein
MRVAIVIVLLATAIGATWSYARRDLRTCVVDDTLQPISSLLEENRKIIENLKSGGYTESESALLQTYLTRIRSNGVPQNSAMKQRIDTLVDNNGIIIALLSKYQSHARTAAFKAAADQYRSYATSMRDRWQSVFEIFMAGGNLPAANPEQPPEFAAALEDELR